MNELSTKLKNSIVKHLNSCDESFDVPYLIKGEKTYNRRQLVFEIENETNLGIEILSQMIILAIDITSRKKN